MKTRTVLFLCQCLIALVYMSACSREQVDKDQKNADQGNSNLRKDPEAYRKAVTSRDGNVSFVIEDVKQDNQTLTVTVKGGCSDKAFTFLWDGNILESFPMGINLVLMHQQSDVVCDTEQRFKLSIDLAQILPANLKAGEYVVFVANGSSIQDVTLSPNGVVTYKP